MESLKDIFQYIELRKTENTKVFSVTPFKTSLKVDFGQKTPPYALNGQNTSATFVTKNFVSYRILKSFRTKNIWTFTKFFTTYIRPKLEFNTPSMVWYLLLLKDITHTLSRFKDTTQKRHCICLVCRQTG